MKFRWIARIQIDWNTEDKVVREFAITASDDPNEAMAESVRYVHQSFPDAMAVHCIGVRISGDAQGSVRKWSLYGMVRKIEDEKRV